MRFLAATVLVLCGLKMAAADEATTLSYVRIYADSDGVSHFEERQLTLQAMTSNPAVHGLSLHELAGTDGATFLHLARGTEEDWHTAPRRWFLIVLQGISEVAVSNGEVRRLTPGTVLLMDDTTGKGHKTKVVGDQDHVALVVPVSEVEGLP